MTNPYKLELYRLTTPDSIPNISQAGIFGEHNVVALPHFNIVPEVYDWYLDMYGVQFAESRGFKVESIQEQLND